LSSNTGTGFAVRQIGAADENAGDRRLDEGGCAGHLDRQETARRFSRLLVRPRPSLTTNIEWT
jgi:hypothetical protein